MALFSNDTQLCSKAMINHVRALNRKVRIGVFCMKLELIGEWFIFMESDSADRLEGTMSKHATSHTHFLFPHCRYNYKINGKISGYSVCPLFLTRVQFSCWQSGAERGTQSFGE